jgi:uncharacterized protein involved in exopolysaccharide biosynthesis
MFEVPRPIQTAVAGNTSVAAIDIPSDGGLDLRRILSILWRGKTIILGTIATSLLVAALFAMLAPHRYTATTQILIDPTTS